MSLVVIVKVCSKALNMRKTVGFRAFQLDDIFISAALVGT